MSFRPPTDHWEHRHPLLTTCAGMQAHGSNSGRLACESQRNDLYRAVRVTQSSVPGQNDPVHRSARRPSDRRSRNSDVQYNDNQHGHITDYNMRRRQALYFTQDADPYAGQAGAEPIPFYTAQADLVHHDRPQYARTHRQAVSSVDAARPESHAPQDQSRARNRDLNYWAHTCSDDAGRATQAQRVPINNLTLPGALNYQNLRAQRATEHQLIHARRNETGMFFVPFDSPRHRHLVRNDPGRSLTRSSNLSQFQPRGYRESIDRSFCHGPMQTRNFETIGGARNDCSRVMPHEEVDLSQFNSAPVGNQGNLHVPVSAIQAMRDYDNRLGPFSHTSVMPDPRRSMELPLVVANCNQDGFMTDHELQNRGVRSRNLWPTPSARPRNSFVEEDSSGSKLEDCDSEDDESQGTPRPPSAPVYQSTQQIPDDDDEEAQDTLHVTCPYPGCRRRLTVDEVRTLHRNHTFPPHRSSVAPEIISIDPKQSQSSRILSSNAEGESGDHENAMIIQDNRGHGVDENTVEDPTEEDDELFYNAQEFPFPILPEPDNDEQ